MVVARNWSEGGEGAVELAEALVNACAKPNNFHYLYDLNETIENKILTIAREMYGAGSIDLESKAKEKIELYNSQVSNCFASLCFEINYIKIYFSLSGIQPFAHLHGKNIEFTDR